MLGSGACRLNSWHSWLVPALAQQGERAEGQVGKVLFLENFAHS